MSPAEMPSPHPLHKHQPTRKQQQSLTPGRSEPTHTLHSPREIRNEVSMSNKGMYRTPGWTIEIPEKKAVFSPSHLRYHPCSQSMTKWLQTQGHTIRAETITDFAKIQLTQRRSNRLVRYCKESIWLTSWALEQHCQQSSTAEITCLVACCAAQTNDCVISSNP